uniref:Uncharacterized protein n=1 Tax=Romanomermis culicivorax TaxID=13658 RepID=A0A915II77_ROMCU
ITNRERQRAKAQAPACSQLATENQLGDPTRGQPVCGFDIEKVHQDKVTALFKRREVNNPMGKRFARYVSFALTNSQMYVMDTTTLMVKEWTSLHDFLNSNMLFAGHSVLEDLIRNDKSLLKHKAYKLKISSNKDAAQDQQQQGAATTSSENEA